MFSQLAFVLLVASAAHGFIAAPTSFKTSAFTPFYHIVSPQHRLLSLDATSTSTRRTGQDFYGILGVNPEANMSEIKKAYRRMAKQHHPDANPGHDTIDKFLEVTRAYEVLADPNLKKRYDTLGAPVKGADLSYEMEVDLRTADFGGGKTVRLWHLETCGTCFGNGFKTCRNCKGAGQRVQITKTKLGILETTQICPACEGAGHKIEEDCKTCAGHGMYQKLKDLQVYIPSGMQSGDQLVMKGEGDAGPNKGPPGDLYIKLRVKVDWWNRDSPTRMVGVAF